MPGVSAEVSWSSTLLIMIPLFNDWIALRKLLLLLDEVLGEHLLQASVLVVDDGSTVAAGPDFPGQACFNALERIAILRLRRNLGHQRAIAIGLAYAADKIRPGTVILMDSDGEDDPKDVPRLLKKYREERAEKIIF